MNEFILEEKNEYWDDKISLGEYIKSAEESGYIDCSGNLDYEFWYILENLKKANNLQSKIDKAIEYIEKDILDNKIEKVDWDFDDCYFSDMPAERIKPLIDILKEDE